MREEKEVSTRSVTLASWIPGQGGAGKISGERMWVSCLRGQGRWQLVSLMVGGGAYPRGVSLEPRW